MKLKSFTQKNIDNTDFVIGHDKDGCPVKFTPSQLAEYICSICEASNGSYCYNYDNSKLQTESGIFYVEANDGCKCSEVLYSDINKIHINCENDFGIKLEEWLQAGNNIPLTFYVNQSDDPNSFAFLNITNVIKDINYTCQYILDVEFIEGNGSFSNNNSYCFYYINSSDILIRNIGTGAEIYKGQNGAYHELKTLLSLNNSINIVENADEISFEVNPAFIPAQKTIQNIGDGDNQLLLPTITDDFYQIRTLKNKGNGLSIYGGVDNESSYFKTIKSNSLLISENPDGGIQLDTLDYFQNLEDYYVNSNYTPTIQNPADGTIIRPYPTFDEAYNAVVGSGTFWNPENKNKRIVIQTPSTATINPTLNYTEIRLDGVGVSLHYTGIDLYMFDMSLIVNAIPKGALRQELTMPANFKISGSGLIARTNGWGLVKAVGYNATSYLYTDMSPNVVIESLGGLEFQEEYRRNEMLPLTEADNVTPIMFAGYPLYGINTIAPVTPLFYVDGNSVTRNDLMFIGDTINIFHGTQIGFHNMGGNVIIGCKNFNITMNGFYISYSTKGTFPVGHPFDPTGVRAQYKPRTDMYAFINEQTPANGNFVSLLGNYGSEKATHLQGGYQAYFLCKNGSIITFYKSMKLQSVVTMNYAIEFQGTPSSSFYFINGDIFSLFGLGVFLGNGINHNINASNSTFNYGNVPLYTNMGTSKIITSGTYCFLNAIPYRTNVPFFNSNADAILGGLIESMEYIQIGTNEIKTVI